jgi:hypothetical protein
MAGLLDYITEAAKAQYAKGAPYRNALGGLLSGDMTALQELNKPSPVMPNEALDVAMTFAPMGIVGGDITKILKSLKQQNPSTYPKIPVNKIFKNEVGNLESLDRMKADEGFLNNATTNQFVNINDIIPTQKNVTTKNIKDINNVSALPELIKVNDKYYVNDGHHRISRDILTGDDKIQAKVYEGLLQNKTPLTEFEVKQLTAQRNAALPVAEGGLGLPASNTAMDRAKALGFDINNPAYHGTTKDISEFDVNAARGKGFNTGSNVTDNPYLANTYTMGINSGNVMPLYIRDNPAMVVEAGGKNWNRLGQSTKVKAPAISVVDKETNDLLTQLGVKSNNNPVVKKGFSKTLKKMFPDEFLFDDYFSTDDLARFARNQGYGSAKFNDIVDIGSSGMMVTEKSGLPSNNQVIFDPSLIRSTNAAFDPFRRNEADILAGVGVGVPVASGLLDIENKKVPKKEKKKTK